MTSFVSRLVLPALLGLLCACSSSNTTTTFTSANYTGTYIGTWTNTTFSSTGAASIVVSTSGSNLSALLDLDGGIFGGSDPAAETLTLTVGDTSATLDTHTSSVYGGMSGTINGNNQVTAAGSDITGSVASFSLSGTWTTTSIDVTVTITFDDASTASATATLTKQ